MMLMLIKVKQHTYRKEYIDDNYENRLSLKLTTLLEMWWIHCFNFYDQLFNFLINMPFISLSFFLNEKGKIKGEL